MRALKSWGALVVLAMLASPPLAAQSFSDWAKQFMQSPATNQALSNSDIAVALRQALAKGTRSAVNMLGRNNGFWDNPAVRIPLPGPITQIEGVLNSLGMGPQVNALHANINHAAEQAVPVAADVFSQAVQKLTLNDVRQILNGPPDAATQYFKRTTTATLTQKFEPIVAKVMSRSGLVQQYNHVVASAGPLGGMLGQNANLNAYVTRKALDGLFLEVGNEERQIRSDPAARTTEMMKKVFGSK